MIIVGARGFAKEVFEVVLQISEFENLAFYDDINVNPADLYGYPIISTQDDAIASLQSDNRFVIGLGNPFLRSEIAEKFSNWGGKLTTIISPLAQVGSHDVKIDNGCNILQGCIISNSVRVGTGCILYYNSIVTHDCIIGDYVEISPAAVLLGRCTVGSFSRIGSNATILPDIEIGQNVIIGAGSVVTRNIPDNVIAYGNPAKIIRKTETIIPVIK